MALQHVSMDFLARRSEEAGNHWFDYSNMAFARTSLPDAAVLAPNGTAFFVSGELTADQDARRYTIRRQTPDGRTVTVGAFREYESRAEAESAMKIMVLLETVVEVKQSP